MYTIIGLGNPGVEYEHTRHNVGWIALNHTIDREKFPEPFSASAASGEMAVGVLFGCDARIVFPHTFMNRIGGAVLKLLGKGNSAKELIIVHDDIDLPFGTVRVSHARGAGGHNGVRSVIESIGTNEFTRIRIGIAEKTLFGSLKRPTGEALSRFVLTDFRKREMAMLPEVCEKVRRALELIMTESVEKAMQEMNGDRETGI